MASWKSPREIAFIYDDAGVLESISVARTIVTADGFEVQQGMKNYPVHEGEGLPEEGEVSSELQALGEAAILQKGAELAVEPVE